MPIAYMAIHEAGKITFREYDVVPPMLTLYVGTTPDQAVSNLLARLRARTRIAARQVQALQTEQRLVLQWLRSFNEGLYAAEIDARVGAGE